MKKRKTISNNSNLLRLLYNSYLPKVVNCAIDINLFDVLAQKELSLKEISGKLNTVETITEALLDVLVAVDLIKINEGKYSLLQTANDFFLDVSKANIVSTVKNFSGSAGPFDNLKAVLREGPPVFNDRMWTNANSIASMEHQQYGGAIQNVLAFIRTIPEFKACKKMCDFAGSVGYFSFEFIQENPQIESHVYDLPEVCDLAKEMKKDEEYYNRITYHDFDMASNRSFGSGYDLFFGSHFLYEFNAERTLAEFFKQVNQAMNSGGLFVSNHITSNPDGENDVTLSIVELMTRCIGYPTHQLAEIDLKTALKKAGFGEFRTKYLADKAPYPTLLLSAVKIMEI